MAAAFRTTLDESVAITGTDDQPIPGVVVIFSGGRPRCVPIRIGPTAKPLVLGRDPGDGVVVVDDDRISRRHTRVLLKDGSVQVTDLDSRNGTFVDGHRIADETFAKTPRVLRLGQSLLIFADLAPYLGGGVEVFPDEVVGPVLRRARNTIASGATSRDTLLLTGPSGSGKEHAARAFHDASGAKGAFVAVNCATIPTGLAERLLFGAKKGAYSGATTDADGYVQAADGGTLFLDEVAELDPAVQPKLLRVLEQREVVSLGAAHPRKVDVRVCVATLKDLRAEVNAGRFRGDLFYRINQLEVRLPSLQERLEELPFLITRELERLDSEIHAHVSFVEACALRRWPGNVRELLGEVRRAGRDALAGGRHTLKDRDLSESAGREIVDGRAPTGSGASSAPSMPPEVSRETIESALKAEGGNVTRAAKTLGMHRNQLRRWLAKNAVDPKTYGPAVEDDTTHEGDGTSGNPNE